MTTHRKGDRGRPRLGLTKKVSLTLTEDEWAKIDASEMTVAAFLKEKMHAEKTQEFAGMVREAAAPYAGDSKETGFKRKYADEYWKRAVDEYQDQYDSEVFEEAYKSLVNTLFPKQSDIAITNTKIQYECPFTNKKFGSINNLIKNAIPYLLESTQKYKQVREETRAVRDRKAGATYFDQIR